MVYSSEQVYTDGKVCLGIYLCIQGPWTLSVKTVCNKYLNSGEEESQSSLKHELEIQVSGRETKKQTVDSNFQFITDIHFQEEKIR